MDRLDLLFLFDEDNPCWTEKLIRMAGEDPAPLSFLAESGLVERGAEAWRLTDNGRRAFIKTAEANYLAAFPGTEIDSEDACLFRTRLRLLLDGKHLQRWGKKEFISRARFPIPSLPDGRIFSENPLTWLWPDDPVFARMRDEWPVVGLAAREKSPPSPGAAFEWLEASGEGLAFFEADLLHLSRYDFQSYSHIPRSPNDPWGLLNADRFFCVRQPVHEKPNGHALLSTIGRFQLALEVLRRMILPGYMDHDSFDQSAVNWLVFVCDDEKEAEALISLLRPFRRELIRPAAPMEVWALDMESLAAFPERAENIHDLLPIVAKPIVR
ncbi:MAG: hypothetical protein GX181_09285 [Synergistaceae bacterium]|nr:hypothetical protein [Synergistota bacterium]NLM72133.1 hypothetical protein [Synergistaceae bacterium]